MSDHDGVMSKGEGVLRRRVALGGAAALFGGALAAGAGVRPAAANTPLDDDVAILVDDGQSLTRAAVDARVEAGMSTLRPTNGQRAVGQDELVWNVRDHGAVGDGTADDTSALQAAIDAVAAQGGGVVHLPAGTYRISATVTIRPGVTIHGANGPAPRAAGPSTITVTQQAGPGLVAGGADWALADLSIVYTDTAYSGALLVAGGAPFGTVQNCWLGAEPMWQATYGARCLVDLHGSQNVLFDNCRFYGAVDLIHGVNVAAPDAKFAKVVAFRSCTFNRYNGWCVVNPHESWTFDNCVFEPTQDKYGRALIVQAGHTPNSVVMSACWMGDNLEVADWIEWRGMGLMIIGLRAVVQGSLVKIVGAGSQVTVAGSLAFGAVAGSCLIDATAQPDAQVTALGTRIGGHSTLFKDDVTTHGYVVLADDSDRLRSQRLQLGNGTASAPSLTFDGNPSAGFYYDPAKGVVGRADGLTPLIFGDGRVSLTGDLRHFGSSLGFHGVPAVPRATLPDAASVTAADLRQVLIDLGLAQ